MTQSRAPRRGEGGREQSAEDDRETEGSEPDAGGAKRRTAEVGSGAVAIVWRLCL